MAKRGKGKKSRGAPKSAKKTQRKAPAKRAKSAKSGKRARKKSAPRTVVTTTRTAIKKSYADNGKKRRKHKRAERNGIMRFAKQAASFETLKTVGAITVGAGITQMSPAFLPEKWSEGKRIHIVRIGSGLVVSGLTAFVSTKRAVEVLVGSAAIYALHGFVAGARWLAAKARGTETSSPTAPAPAPAATAGLRSAEPGLLAGFRGTEKQIAPPAVAGMRAAHEFEFVGGFN